MGDGGLRMGDWPQPPIPNPQSPIPNPQSPYFHFIQKNNIKKNLNKLKNINFKIFIFIINANKNK